MEFIILLAWKLDVHRMHCNLQGQRVGGGLEHVRPPDKAVDIDHLVPLPDPARDERRPNDPTLLPTDPPRNDALIKIHPLHDDRLTPPLGLHRQPQRKKAKLPPARGRAVDLDLVREEIELDAAEVEAEADPEGFGVRFFERPEPVDPLERFVRGEGRGARCEECFFERRELCGAFQNRIVVSDRC